MAALPIPLWRVAKAHIRRIYENTKLDAHLNCVFHMDAVNSWVINLKYYSVLFAHHVYGELYMKRAIKPLKYILLFKGCFIACVIALAVFAYSVCWGVSLLGQQAEHGKQYIYAKAQAVVVAAGSRLGVIHTEEEQQLAIEQQVLSILKEDEQNTITKDAFEEMQESVAPVKKKYSGYTKQQQAQLNNLIESTTGGE